MEYTTYCGDLENVLWAYSAPLLLGAKQLKKTAGCGRACLKNDKVKG